MAESVAVASKRESVAPLTLLFLIILLLLPFAMDFSAKLFLALGAKAAASFVQSNLWLEGVLAYLPVYLLMLFYIKTTFNPLSVFGYTWNKQYLGWAFYIGIGSGIIIFLVDLLSTAPETVQPFSGIVLIGYLLSWVLLPLLVEETLFRGVIQSYYQKKLTKTFTRWNIHVAIIFGVVAEVIFHLSIPVYYGFTHGGAINAFFTTLPQILYVIVFGGISGYLYQRTGSLTTPFLIHGLGNLTELILIWGFRF